jgi:hypothetical protein
VLLGFGLEHVGSGAERTRLLKTAFAHLFATR